MIYFVTNKAEEYREYLKFTIKEFDDIRVVDVKTGLRLYYNVIGNAMIQSLDLETTGLDPYVSDIMLTGIGTSANKFVFSYDVDITSIYEHIEKRKIVIVGANLKFDIKFIQVNYNILLTRVYDVILAEQRLFMGYYRQNNLGELVKRYLKEYRDKDVRLEFVNKNVSTFKIEYHHIKYLANDLDDPLRIRAKQRPIIKKYKMEFLIYGIEFPLISVLADSENTGIDFDSNKWISIIASNKAKRLEIQLKLDEEVKKIRDYVATNNLYKGLNPMIALGGNKYNKLRTATVAEEYINDDGTTNVLDLFGDASTIKALTNKKDYKPDPKLSVNYNTPTEMVKIFGRLNQPMVTETGYAIPSFTSNGLSYLPVSTYKVSMVAFEKYLLERPDSIMIDFIKLWIEFSTVQTKITSFGINFIQKINPVTGKLHTIYRQCAAITGRFQSGGGKKEKDKFQSQNVPAEAQYRACFVAPEHYKLNTSDYQGAELIVMASHAQDFKLISLSKIDMHSHMATVCWRNIYKIRAGKISKQLQKLTGGIKAELEQEWQRYIDLGKNFIVTKSDPPGFRKGFKGMTFGTIYGMFSKKAGATLNLPKEEGQIVINTIKKELPDTFRMVESATEAAVKQGYVILNYRTNSRRWFPRLIEQLKKEISKDTHFIEISAEESEARNVRIQGTQADFIKEASVLLAIYYRKHKLDAKILLWVHDEIVDKVNDNLLLSENNKVVTTLLPHKFIKGKFYKDVAEVKHSIMVEVANRYLNNVTIGADHEVAQCWIK
jgi:DNA polymerase I-like protein with 3'-5' exonuclease and polymerase domains